MNVKKLIAAVAVFAAAGSVFAGDLMPFTEMDNFQSTRTRADVRAETMRNRDQIALAHGDIGAFEQPAATSTRTRLAVRKEAIESVRNHRAVGHNDIGG
ncbi:DUF4148 domain-containing protein [Actimicrobium sp. CCC2.4]|uniref:DUF4148 domain-containing protein n=1 Tax=Actimicrobium sp. CCC2.4 TaxID=3048606 RepID=UPI000204B713|nr:DUF4148 domain-containing protein [Actimicrobium sp. CCC2.4]EGF31948.1 hypothetical protein IMCC9480_3178 [Oxalobacteraceae bacterium IMCC9480]MEB0134434.1 DUF4148 domain-containing protein [Actimicrobium sp. CCC2.4]NDP59430.1 DUF4148 domain-containing protein [Oxalobacteraceae bacterium]WPX33070.1 DUF4148 domain-containing protein [Actimicrobium sp. CCC2.4]